MFVVCTLVNRNWAKTTGQIHMKILPDVVNLVVTPLLVVLDDSFSNVQIRVNNPYQHYKMVTL